MGSVVVLLLLVFERKRPLPLTCLSVVYLGRCLRWCALLFFLPLFLLHSVFINLGRYTPTTGLDWTGLDSNEWAIGIAGPLLSLRFTWRLYLGDRGSTLTAWGKSWESSNGCWEGRKKGKGGGRGRSEAQCYSRLSANNGFEAVWWKGGKSER